MSLMPEYKQDAPMPPVITASPAKFNAIEASIKTKRGAKYPPFELLLSERIISTMEYRDAMLRAEKPAPAINLTMGLIYAVFVVVVVFSFTAALAEDTSALLPTNNASDKNNVLFIQVSYM